LVTLPSRKLNVHSVSYMAPADQLAYLPHDCDAQKLCASIAEIFQVKETEVALLELRGKLLHFLYPEELKTAGAIPVSSSAVAARTAQAKKAEIFNSFTQVSHFSIFEAVKLGDRGLDAQVIQKLVSAPVLNTEGLVLGVIQISRKGPRPAIAGPDFTPSDLQTLESVAQFVAKFMARGRAKAQAASQAF
jgi:GAF domain-containing protein